MNKQFLFPHWCKTTGFCLMAVGILMLITQEWIGSSGILSFKGGYGHFLFLSGKQLNGTVDISSNLLSFLFAFGALLAGFSREKIEDEFIAKIRLSSLSWTVFTVFALTLIFGALLQVIGFKTESSSNLFLYFWGINKLLSGITTILFIHAILFNISLFKNSRKEVEA